VPADRRYASSPPSARVGLFVLIWTWSFDGSQSIDAELGLTSDPDYIHPITRGVISDFDAFEKLVAYALEAELRIRPEEMGMPVSRLGFP
jgi:hypothetical protein